MALSFKQFGQGCSGFVVLEDIELKADQSSRLIDSVKNRLKRISPLPEQLDASRYGEFVFEDSLNGRNGEPVSHPYKFLSQIFSHVQEPGKKQEGSGWTISIHILRFCSVRFFD